MTSLEGLYHAVMGAVIETANKSLPANFIDRKGKAYLMASS